MKLTREQKQMLKKMLRSVENPKMKYLELENLYRKFLEWCKQLDMDYQVIDFSQVVDLSLSYDENLEIIKEQIKALNPDFFSEEEVKNKLDEYEHLEREMTKREEEYYRKLWEERIREIKEALEFLRKLAGKKFRDLSEPLSP